MQYRTPKAGSIRSRISLHVMVPLVASVLMLVAACDQGPSTLAPTMSGTKVDLAGSEWLVVNYWAEWCGPCRHEIPELNELDAPSLIAGSAALPEVGQEAIQEAGPDALLASKTPEVSVLGVNYDGLVDDKLAQVSERMGITFAVLTQDPREQWGQPLPTVLPSTYLIAPGGEFIETLVGPQTRAGIISRIESLEAKRAREAG